MKTFSHWKKHREPRDYQWNTYPEEDNYGWLKRLVIATVIFAVVYGIHVSGMGISKPVDDAVSYTLNTQTDFVALADRISPYLPQNMDISVLKKIQNTVSKPADPLMYMNSPAEGKVVSPFGMRMHPVLKKEMMHEGIDIEAPIGASVRAASAGKIKDITEDAELGKVLTIEHGTDIESRYGHLSEVLVKSGDMVSQGQVVARVGKTGMVNTPLLYFEVREKGVAIDPMTRIKGSFPTNEGK